MIDSRAQEVMDQQSAMEVARSGFDSHWKEVRDYLFPTQVGFNGETREAGRKVQDRIFDSTPQLALDRFASVVQSVMTPQTQRYQRLQSGIPALDNDIEVRRWFEQATDTLFRVRYTPAAGYSAQSLETYRQLGAFGTGTIYTTEMLGRGLRYKAVFVAELFVAEDQFGMVDTVHRKYKFTARQAMQAFGERLPEVIKNAAEREPLRQFEFIHCVKLNDNYKPGSRDAKHYRFASYDVCCEDKSLVGEGGYRTMPYAVARYTTAPGECYGRSPAMMALADIKTLQEMEKTILRAGQRVVDPPLLLPEEGMLEAFSMMPNALNYGGLDSQGNQLVRPLQTGANLPWGMELSEQRRKAINDAFLVTLFQILVETPNMTATEAMIRAQEKAALIGPPMGRLQTELLGVQTEREIDLLLAAGQLPPMPSKLLKARGEYRIEYTAPINRMQRAEDGIAILRTLEQVTPLANFDPGVMDTFNAKKIAKKLADINGMPADCQNSEAEVRALGAQRAQQQAVSAMVEAAPAAARASRDMAEATRINMGGA